MTILKDHKGHIAQALLMVILIAIPLFYFSQKVHDIRNDYYTERMTAISEKIGGELERQVIWEDSKDENQSSIMYTAYYYPQALSVVCRTTPVIYVRDQNTPPGAAFLVSDSGTIYPATVVEDTEYNATLLIFEDVPSEFVNHLAYLDIVPSQEVPENGVYNPSQVIEDRIRYSLQGEKA